MGENNSPEWVGRIIEEQGRALGDEDGRQSIPTKTITNKTKRRFEDGLLERSNPEGVVQNKMRRDATTRGHKQGHIYDGHTDSQRRAEAIERRSDVFGKQDIDQAGVPLNVPLNLRREEILEELELQREAYYNDQDTGEYNEWRHLAGNSGVATINDETEFTDGRNPDGTYREGYWFEPTDEEVIEIELQTDAEDRKKGQFYEDRGNKGRRGRGRWYRG